MPWPPNERERELARAHGVDAEVLAVYREELLEPFEELGYDMRELGQRKVFEYLDNVVQRLRGIP